MKIEIRRTITVEYLTGNFQAVDLNDLEDFLNEKFHGKDYGNSVLKYVFGFDLYKFNGGFAQFLSNNVEIYKPKSNCYITNSHFDWNNVINLNPTETLSLIVEEFYKSIGRIENKKQKPKDFNYKNFQQDFIVIANEYKLNKTSANTR
jgi:hypothetical protein